MKNKILFVLIFSIFYNVNCFSQYGGSLAFYSLIDFESPLDTNLNIIFNNDTNDLWQIGKPQKPFASSSNSLPNAIITDTVNPYFGQNNSWFDIKIKTQLWMGHAMQLDFMHKYENDSLHSKCFVEISYDQGLTWSNVINNQNVGMGLIYYDNFYSQNDTSISGIAGFSGNCNTWQFSSVYWIWDASAKNIVDTVVIRFHFISDSLAVAGGGWVIDDIHVLGFDNYWNVPENSANNDITFYPNPTKENLIVKFNKQYVNVLVYNLSGQIIKNEKIYNNIFILRKQDIGKGVFLIKCVKINGEFETKPVVIE